MTKLKHPNFDQTFSFFFIGRNYLQLVSQNIGASFPGLPEQSGPGLARRSQWRQN